MVLGQGCTMVIGTPLNQSRSVLVLLRVRNSTGTPECTSRDVQVAMYKSRCTSSDVQVAMYKSRCTSSDVQVAMYK